MHARAIAALILTKVINSHKSLSDLLPHYKNSVPNKKDQSFIQELCFGVSRWYYRLDFILQELLEKDLRHKDTDIKILILLGLYQLAFLRTPPHAAVSATVEACVDLQKPWAKQLINAILRNYQRESEYLHTLIEKNLVAKYAHPYWMLEYMQQDYPDKWQELALANNNYPPMYLRINNRLTNRPNYLIELGKAGIEAAETPFNKTGIRLIQAIDVEDLPYFEEGYVSVQDLAAQLTLSLLDIRPGHRVLDACAAPGGKLGHILEQSSVSGNIVAIENDINRYELLQHTLNRLQLTATLFQADARATEQWWDGNLFDRILLDTPCSAMGVIRRHPDIKILRQPADISRLIHLQTELLTSLWPLLARKGKLIYVTCSVLSVENDNQIRVFTEKHSDAKSLMINAEWGQATTFGRQILPGDNDMDGFYYACLEKK